MEYTAIVLVVVAALALALVGIMVSRQLEYMKNFGLNTLNMCETVSYNPVNFIREMSEENLVRFRVNSYSSSYMDFSGKDLTKVCRIAFTMPNIMKCYHYDEANNISMTGEFKIAMADGSPAPMKLINTVSTTVLKLKVWKVDKDDMHASDLKNATKLGSDTLLNKGSLVIDVSMAGALQAQIPVIIPLINNGSPELKPDDFWWRLITPHKLCVLGEDDF